MGKRFNEVVAMDLGEIEEHKFMATKYCQAAWLKNKTPEEIIDKLLEN